MPWYLEAWDWIKDHPYISIGGAAGIVGAFVLLHRSNAQTSPLAGLSPSQQYRLQSQQIAANSPLAIAQAQARAAIGQANAAARAQIAPATAQAQSNTAIARAQAASQNLLARLGLQSSLAQTSATTQQDTIAARLQSILGMIGLAQSGQVQQTAQEEALAATYPSYLSSLITGANAGMTESDFPSIGQLFTDNPISAIFGGVPSTYTPISFGQTNPTTVFPL